MNLYHYTCVHRARLIGQRGTLNPNPQPFLDGRALVWLTDLAEPDRDGLGLTSSMLHCDRTEIRYTVVDSQNVAVMSWHQWAEIEHIPRNVRSALEFGGKPLHWYVALGPIQVVQLDKQAEFEADAYGRWIVSGHGVTARVLTVDELAALDPQPRPFDECEMLHAASRRAFKAYQIAEDPAERETARQAFLAAADKWAVAYYGGIGDPWHRFKAVIP